MTPGSLFFRSPSNVSPEQRDVSVDNFHSLLIIRSIALLGQTGVLGYVVFVSRSRDVLWGLAAALVLLAGVTVASFWRAGRAATIPDRELFAQLLLDVLCWTGLMYFSGGANNPFISYYLVPVVISAAVLPRHHTWLVMTAALAAYSLLLYFHIPFPLFSPMASHGHATSAHTLGMWFNFLFSACLISFFVVRMAAQLREQEARAMAQREERLRDEQILAVAGLAAGTAHELGTPLNTMTVVVDETLARGDLSASLRDDHELLRDQLAACRNILQRLTRTADMDRSTPHHSLPAAESMRRIVQRWASRRPGAPYELTVAGRGSGPDMEQDITLIQAIENVLNNAADTGNGAIDITLDWDENEIRLAVRDQGPGFSPQMLAAQQGTAVQKSVSGLGIGLMLSQSTVERLGGKILLENADDGKPGARVRILLPATSRENSGVPVTDNGARNG